MKKNLPVSGKEYIVSCGDMLVSVTDTKGRITYCNSAFQRVSGFERSELLGQPHNIVRHPDMPEEAFRDLWATLASGSPWTGLVKNRRKNGDHYWVRAHAAPMYRSKNIVGYISVRTAADQGAIRAAEALYNDMRMQVEQGRLRIGLNKGLPVDLGFWPTLVRRFRPGRGVAFWLAMLLSSSVVASLAAWSPYAGGGASLVFSSAVALFVWRHYISGLQALVPVVNQLATGDLMADMPDLQPGATRPLVQALAQLAVNLRAIGGDVRAEIVELRSAAIEIAGRNQELSARTEAQASSVEETAASTEEISGTASQNASSASRGEMLANDLKHEAASNKLAMERVSEAMREIDMAWAKMNDMIGTIEGVAFQTNLLALNAAVEAARAGEAGRGFAVVAAEVRVLSNRVSTAAGDIKQLILESSKKVQAGGQEVHVAASRMNDALESVQRVSSVLSQITSAACEQQSGVSQISEAVSHLDTITQQNAAMVQELTSSTLALREHAQRVSESIQLIRVASGDVTLAEIDAVALRRAG